MRVTNWPNILVDQGPFSDPDFISGTHQSENVQFADKLSYQVRIYGKTTTKVGQLDYVCGKVQLYDSDFLKLHSSTCRYLTIFHQ